MDSNEIRERFLSFFKSKGHAVVPSDSLVPANDPSLLFTGAGMNQFKDYFLGLKKDLRRAASCQKCFRTGDVEQVGRTASHLTFFEMLGNFSFGDYFKKEAIQWGWEFLTVEMKIPADRLWATVYESDDEAARIWKEQMGLPAQRIVRMGAKDNFWPSNAPTEGPNGPCGPCSELHYDTGCCQIGKQCPNPEQCRPGCPCGRFVEVWNLVFTQYDRQPDGSLKDLPSRNIDTGMGLERLTAVMQDKMAVFETDLFQPIVEGIAALVRSSTSSERTEPVMVSLSNHDQSALYAIADHARALTLLVSDGVLPSNEGRGYVLRMLLRKAERAGMALGLNAPFLYRLVPAVTKKMGQAYPDLPGRRETIAQAILAEEIRFHQTLKDKIPLLEEKIQNTVPGTGTVPGTDVSRFSADIAARFYDTHGISYDEIAEVCRKKAVQPPARAEFDQALEALQQKSKGASSFSKEIFSKDELVGLVGNLSPTQFTGYQGVTGKGQVLAIVRDNRSVEEVSAPAKIALVLDRTPFYGEAGGQVGDAGVLQSPSARIQVLDTQRLGEVWVHRAEVQQGTLRVSDLLEERVDAERRKKVAQNHTATHLLHAALKKVLGPHVMQAGSLVAPDHLRFDFSHPQAVSRPEMEKVQALVNEWIRNGYSVSTAEMPIDEARRTGAAALFGEKYGRTVRVVSMGDVSKELCGGTHLASSREVGSFVIAKESSIAAGMRRIEALTDREAEAFLQREAVRLKEEQQRALQRAQQKEQEEKDQQRKMQEAQQQLPEAAAVGSVSWVGSQLPGELGHASLRVLADRLKSREQKIVIFLADQAGNCVVSSGQPAIRADALLKLATEVAGGSGGGRPEMAQGRLKEPARFAEVKGRIVQFIQEHSS